MNKIKKLQELKILDKNGNFNRQKIIITTEILQFFNKTSINRNELYMLSYMFLKDIKDVPKCLYCNKEVDFISMTKGFKKFCSNSCSSYYKNNDPSFIKKIKQIKLEKYKDENYHNIKKMKSTNKKKYGIECSAQNFEIKEKIKQTNLEKYGVDNPWKSKNIRVKIKQTNLEKYGVDYPMKSEEILKKSLDERKRNFYLKFVSSDRFKTIEPLFTMEEYDKGCYKEYKWKCCECNTIFEDKIVRGLIPRCPTCFPKLSGFSNMEKEIVEWLKTLNIEIDENNRTIINPLELDIYIPSHNLAIEFDGLYWHSELQGKDSNYHLNKTNKCLEKSIRLLHIFENEWIEKQDIVKSIIKNNLGLHDKVVYGRNCIVKNISSKEANEFYDINHIQGSCASSINLGLFYQDELVSCLSFAKPRFNKKYDWEITRFANKLNYKVHGSFGKLWKHKPVGSIITYSDKRYFSGSIYKKYMTQLSDSSPAYFYWKKDCILHNRVEFQKHKLASLLDNYDANLTEWENMQLNGYDRIYDCGNWVFIYQH